MLLYLGIKQAGDKALENIVSSVVFEPLKKLAGLDLVVLLVAEDQTIKCLSSCPLPYKIPRRKVLLKRQVKKVVVSTTDLRRGV